MKMNCAIKLRIEEEGTWGRGKGGAELEEEAWVGIDVGKTAPVTLICNLDSLQLLPCRSDGIISDFIVALLDTGREKRHAGLTRIYEARVLTDVDGL